MEDLKMNDIISTITCSPTNTCSIITLCLSTSALLGAGREGSSPHLCSKSCYFGQSCSKGFLAYTTFLDRCSIIQLDPAISSSSAIPPTPYSENPLPQSVCAWACVQVLYVCMQVYTRVWWPEESFGCCATGVGIVTVRMENHVDKPLCACLWEIL